MNDWGYRDQDVKNTNWLVTLRVFKKLSISGFPIWDDAFQVFSESWHSLIHHPYMRLNLVAAMSSNLKVNWRPSCKLHKSSYNHYPIISLFFILALVSIMIQYPISIDSLTDVSFQHAFGLKAPQNCRVKSCQTHGIVGDYKYLPPRSLKLDKRLRTGEVAW